MRIVGAGAFIAFVVSVLVSQASAQSTRVVPSNIVGVELLGRGPLYSFNYERVVKTRIGIGIGVGTWSFSGGFFSSSTTRTVSIPTYVSLNPLGDTHSFYVGAGATTMLRQQTAPSTEFSADIMPSATVGYQFRSSSSGLLIRPTVSYVRLDGLNGVWPGLMIGKTW
jgi:hypothetical protein